MSFVLFLLPSFSFCRFCLSNSSLRWQGTLPGWWLGEADNRYNEPFVSIERWDNELRDAGFRGVNAAVMDDEYPYQLNANIVAVAAERTIPATGITLLYDKDKIEFSQRLSSHFENNGFAVTWRQIMDEEACLADQDVISTLDLEGPYFHDITRENYEKFMKYLSRLKSGVMWLTRPAQLHCRDPRYGQVIGLARTIRSELSVDFSTVELQNLDSTTIDAIVTVYKKFQRRSGSSDYTAEMEFVVEDGAIQIPRYHWISLPNELEETPRDYGPTRLTISKYGLIDSIQWVQGDLNVVHGHEVEVDIRSVGLNFRVCHPLFYNQFSIVHYAYLIYIVGYSSGYEHCGQHDGRDRP